LQPGPAGHLPADRLGEEVSIDPPNEVDRRTLGPGDMFDGSEYLPFAIGVTNRGIRSGLLPGHIADDTEALSDQLDDSLIEVAQSLAEREEFSVRLWHAPSLRSTGRKTAGFVSAEDRGPQAGERTDAGQAGACALG
jgi:hypothetical protein